MLKRIIDGLSDPDTRNVALVAGGMAMLTAGLRVPAVAMFGTGVAGLERSWRRKHDFDGTLSERWDAARRFYEGTHQDRTNRVLHMVGIPMIAGGAAGLLFSRPLGPTAPVWAASASSFAAGWALNIVGHAVYEKNAPAFADDPLSFVAGPAWDIMQLRHGLQSQSPDQVAAD